MLWLQPVSWGLVLAGRGSAAIALTSVLAEVVQRAMAGRRAARTAAAPAGGTPDDLKPGRAGRVLDVCRINLLGCMLGAVSSGDNAIRPRP
jgi:hypothetical protein